MSNNTPVIKFTPLGGLAQIGSNMSIFSTPNTTIAIDCGILFPNDDHFNLNYLIPNFKNINKIDHLILTHGHEDHIGGIVHFLDHYPQTILWASSFCIELLRKKLVKTQHRPKINKFDSNSNLKFKDINIRPIHVNHSIPETYGLHISDINKN